VAPDTFDWLFDLAQFGIKFGLENMRAIVAELGHPERAFRSLHVAGTNGKGSVTAMAETALRLAGHRTARYTSPHLVDLTERFVIDGRPVDRAALRESADRVRGAVDALRTRGVLEVHPTFFEVTTAIAFDLFRVAQVDVAVCEVGLGGRLDATNVLSPVATAITSIGFDHQQYLGSTLADIAREKAGIIKPGVPVVLGSLPHDAAAAVARIADERHAPLVRSDEEVHVGPVTTVANGQQQFALRTVTRDYGRVQLALAGAHQLGNAAVAVRLLEVAEHQGIAVGAEAIRRALGAVQWPGRLQHLTLANGADALLDAAHNGEGAAALAQYLGSLGAPRPLVFSAMRDKDVTTMLQALLPAVSDIVITRASNPRAAEPADIARLVQTLAPDRRVSTCESPAEAIARASHGGQDVVVAGSIFLLGDVLEAVRLS